MSDLSFGGAHLGGAHVRGAHVGSAHVGGARVEEPASYGASFFVRELLDELGEDHFGSISISSFTFDPLPISYIPWGSASIE